MEEYNISWSADEAYICETAGELLVTLSGRKYYKYNDTKALIAYWYASSGYTGPILVSTDPDAVSFTTSYNSDVLTYSGTVTYENFTWYYSSTGLFMGGNCTSSAGSATHKLTDKQTAEKATLELLELAQVTFASKYYLLFADDTYYTVVTDKAFVDAIIFSGAESFATGIVPTQDTKVEITLNTGTFGGAAVGARTNEGGADAFAIIPASSTTIEGLYGVQDVTATVDDYTDTDVTITLSADGLALAGESIGTVDTEEFEASVGLTIGALNTAGTLESYFTGSINSVIITQGESETLHLVPCVDEERVACFYDTISKTCIYSDTEPGYTDESGAVDTAYKVSELDVTEITAEVFQAYGIEDASLITAKLVSEWTAFKVLKWTDGDTITLTATLTDTTPLPQTIISNAIYLDDTSILGIESVTATYEGNPKVAMSFDDKTTWYIYTDEGWGLLSDETAGMSMDTLIAITTEQWAEKITDLEKMYMRVVLSALEDKVTEIYFDFVN